MDRRCEIKAVQEIITRDACFNIIHLHNRANIRNRKKPERLTILFTMPYGDLVNTESREVPQTLDVTRQTLI